MFDSHCVPERTVVHDHRPTVLITGATGAVGPSVVEAFHAAGYSIRTLSIDPPQTGLFSDDVEVCIGDVTDVAIVQSAMQDVEVVVHLAALLHIVNPSPAFREKYEKVNVDGTANVIKAAVQAGVKRVVFFSTIAVYGNNDGRILTEDSPVKPDTFYARTKLAAERIVLDAKRTDGQPFGTVLRFAAIYGGRVKGNYQRLVQALARGRFISIGDGWNRRTLIYDRDVAKAALLAAQHPKAAGKLYNVSDSHFHTLKEIIVAICHALGRNPPRLSVPVGAARFFAGLMEDVLHLLGRRVPVGRATVEKYIEDIAIDCQLIQKELGFKPQYDLRSGWCETVKEMRELGIL
jgi:nucleoside-diphosphate-sugar epimerase